MSGVPFLLRGVVEEEVHRIVVHSCKQCHEDVHEQRKSGIRIPHIDVSATGVADDLTTVRLISNHWVWTVPSSMFVLCCCRPVIVYEVTWFVQSGSVDCGRCLKRPVDFGHCC